MGVQTSPTPRSATRAARPKRASRAATPINQDLRRALIAKAAYYRAESRGFAGGNEAEDWLAAEIEVDTALTLSAGTTSA
jgi:hypothetical protein